MHSYSFNFGVSRIDSFFFFLQDTQNVILKVPVGSEYLLHFRIVKIPESVQNVVMVYIFHYALISLEMMCIAFIVLFPGKH